ncbi:hypothetical protein KP509_11G031400 [Ceratopteris richardii]|nr:hypothetical protein KP509_11G031400 [Ceratopteris richardii]
MAGRGRRRALADLGDNDSPVIGLFQVVHNCAADQNYPWDLKCVLDNSKFPIQSPYTDPSETPIGENLLRSQVQLLLQSVESDAPTNHKPAVSLRALCHLQPNSMESPALKLVAPTPVKTPRHSVSTCIFPAPISYDSALNGKSRNSALNSCQDQELSAKSCIQEDGGREIHPVETKEEDSASKLFVDVHISPSCEIPKFEYLPISRGSDDRHIIITESVYPGNNRHIVQTAPLISEGYALGFKTTRTLQFDSPNKTPSGNTSCSAGMTFLQAEEIGLLMREQVTEDDTTSEWSTLVNVSSAGRRRGTPYPKGSFVAHIEEDEDDNLESGFEEDGEGHNNRGPPENGSKKVRISHDSDVEM